MRSWLQLRMAKDERLGIFAGVEIGMAENTIEKISSLGNSSSVPSRNAFSLGIELVLTELLKEDGLDIPSGIKNQSKQSHFLASQLTDLFVRYSVYGSGLLKSWKNTKRKDWQQVLWEKVHAKFHWISRVELVEGMDSIPYDSVHFFSVSFLPQVYLDCLERLSHKTPAFGYILSPCRAFWCDILGDKQQSFYLHAVQEKGASIAQQMALEDLLIDTNPLLANFGRMGREMAAQLEKLDDHAEQGYVIPSSVLSVEAYQEYIDEQVFFEPVAKPISLLQALQTDLTLLRPYQGEFIAVEGEGRSLELHGAPTRWREVEVLYNILVEEIAHSQTTDQPLLPSDIIVMAPDIAVYLPYIKAVFEEKEGQLPVQVMDVRMPSTNVYIQAFLALLELAKSGWENKRILDLLDYLPILRKCGWSQEDAVTLRKWIKQSAVHWGFDVKHRDEFLASAYLPQNALDRSEVGTWYSSLKGLCNSLLTSSEDNPVFLEVSDAPLLGEWWEFLYGLKSDLEPISKQEEYPLAQWIAYCNKLVDKYLYSEHDEELVQGHLVLQKTLKELELAFTGKLSFTLIESCLTRALDQVTTTYREGNLQAVRFCSLLPMRAVPAKIIALIGMEAGMYPKKGYDPIGLDLMKSTGLGDYCPRQSDFDRYLFLEALLSAREKLVITFPAQWNHGGHAEEKMPSHLLEELVGYLDKAYRIDGKLPSEKILYQHALPSYHYSHFQTDSVPNYLPSRLSWAKAAYGCLKNGKQNFFDQFADFIPSRSVSEQRVELSTLKSLAANPLKEYLKNVLKVDLERSLKYKNVVDEPLDLPPLDQGSMSSKSLTEEMSRVIHRATVTGKMPFVPIKEVYSRKLYANDAHLSQLASTISETDKKCTFQLSAHYLEVEIGDEMCKFPPLVIPKPQGGHWIIEGEIPMVSPQGLFVYAEAKLGKLIKAWPHFLVLKCLIEKYQLQVDPCILLVHTKINQAVRMDASAINAEENLVRFLEYFEATRVHPSPLLPDWLSSILEGDRNKLQKEFEKDPQSGFNFMDDTVRWLFENETYPDAEGIIQKWQPKAAELFGELQALVSKKESK
jgi:exodeoxyribonuclease V gamma subunit